MAGQIKLQTSAGGGVVLDTATTTATDVTVKVPVTGVNNGTLVCSDSSGNVGIGTSSPISNGGYGGLSLNGTSGALFSLMTNGTESGRIASLGNETSVQCKASTGYITFVQGVSGGTERMRIDTSGNLCVGTTGFTGAAGFSVAPNYSNGSATAVFNRANTASTSYAFYFQNNASTVGSISYTNTATAFTTSSDYRLKENIAPMTGALAIVGQLKPCTYTWKETGEDGQGFIAHELQAVVPDCVTGEKDAVDAEGNPVYQGIDTSFLVATLTKAIQEQQAQIETLTAKVAALEAK